jgi:hypothetical protein
MVQLRRTPIDLPLDVAQGFVRGMQAYFAESNASKRDTIAARQLYAPRKYQRQSEAPIPAFRRQGDGPSDEGPPGER